MSYPTSFITFNKSDVENGGWNACVTKPPKTSTPPQIERRAREREQKWVSPILLFGNLQKRDRLDLLSRILVSAQTRLDGWQKSWRQKWCVFVQSFEIRHLMSDRLNSFLLRLFALPFWPFNREKKKSSPTDWKISRPWSIFPRNHFHLTKVLQSTDHSKAIFFANGHSTAYPVHFSHSGSLFLISGAKKQGPKGSECLMAGEAFPAQKNNYIIVGHLWTQIQLRKYVHTRLSWSFFAMR